MATPREAVIRPVESRGTWAIKKYLGRRCAPICKEKEFAEISHFMINLLQVYLKIYSITTRNHYIEVDYDDNTGNYWLVIHCGSRNLGKQVAEYYQNIAINAKKERIQELNRRKRVSIDIAKFAGRVDIIQDIVNYWNDRIAEEPDDDMCYLEGQDMQNYLHDMRICNDFSKYNHMVIFQEMAEKMGMVAMDYITCIHNYVDVDHGIIRKGAIEGYAGQLGLIPLNMRDGILIVEAKGNEDWNCSLPHGAGRLMSRGEARRSLSLSDFQNEMKGIYSSSVVAETIDEAPMAYKDAEAIIEAIKPNAKIISHMKPVWNFKAK